MSHKKNPWWAFWRKDTNSTEQPKEQKEPGNAQSSQQTSSSASKNLRDPEKTSELHLDELPELPFRGETIDLPADMVPSWKDGATSPSPSAPQTSGVSREAKIQAARARQLGQQQAYIAASSDQLPAASPAASPAAKKAAPEFSKETSVPETPQFGGVFFISSLGFLTILFSVPYWLTQMPPLKNWQGHLGLIAAFQHRSEPSILSSFVFKPSNYVGSGGDYILALVGSIIPLSSISPVAIQLYIVASLFAVIFLLYVTERSIWNACIALFLLPNGAFFEGNLGFMLATPVLIVGIGCVWLWMSDRNNWGAIATVGIAFVLLILDASAYFLFIMAIGCGAFLFSKKTGELLTRLMLPSTSLIAFLPWLLTISGNTISTEGTISPSIPMSWVGFSHKLTGFISGSGYSPHHTENSDMMALSHVIVLLLLMGGAIGFIAALASQKKKTKESIFFPILSLCALVLYFALPTQWQGTSFSGATILAFASFMALGWVDVDLRHNGGRLLLTFIFVGAFGFSTLSIIHVARHKKMSASLQTLVERVPEKSRLLIWRLKASNEATLIQQLSGLYMVKKKGGAGSIRIQGHLRWRLMVEKQKKSKQPKKETTQKMMRNWTHLITSWTPSRSQHPYFRLLQRKGKYKLYRIQLP